jgi:hypothetical protein
MSTGQTCVHSLQPVHLSSMTNRGCRRTVGLEMAGFAFQADEFGQREDFDVQVARAFDELGRDDAGGAIAGRERLVQVRHHAADGGVALDEIDLEAAVGQVEGGLDAGNAAAGHQHRANFLVVVFTHGCLVKLIREHTRARVPMVRRGPADHSRR